MREIVTNKQISALVETGVIAFSTVLCWPGDFSVASAFYRAVLINVACILITEIPKFDYNSNKVLKYCKLFLALVGFILAGIALLNIRNNADIRPFEMCFFWASVVVCIVSVINLYDIMKLDSQVPPTAVDYDPSP